MKKEEVERMAKEEPEKLLDILGNLFRGPYQLLPELTGGEYQFAIGHGPSESTTEDEPPKRIEPTAEVIPIDECLGLYDHAKRRVTIFKKGITRASQLIECNPHHLELIVRLHEWAHAFVHIGLNKEDNLRVLRERGYWRKWLMSVTRRYESINPRLHEQLAQLLAYHSLSLLRKGARYPESQQVIDRIIDTFHWLNRYQPPEYRVDRYIDVPVNRIVGSLTLLKNGWLKGPFEAWSMIVAW